MRVVETLAVNSIAVVAPAFFQSLGGLGIVYDPRKQLVGSLDFSMIVPWKFRMPPNSSGRFFIFVLRSCSFNNQGVP